jgi:hypothetical protein
MKSKNRGKSIQRNAQNVQPTGRPSAGDGGGLGPQPSASAVTEPEPARDASGTGGASGGFNSSVNGVAESSIDRASKRPPTRKA